MSTTSCILRDSVGKFKESFMKGMRALGDILVGQ